MGAFSQEQEESIERKIELYSPILEEGISRRELMKRVRKIESKIVKKRLKWYEENKSSLTYLRDRGIPAVDMLNGFYMVFFQQMEIAQTEDVEFMPIYDSEQGIANIYIICRNFCPYLEAFRRMGIRPDDSVKLCELTLEKPCQALFEKVNPQIKFTRSYRNVRPLAGHCEEILIIRDWSLAEKLDCL